jgi:hypothetical protein
MVVTVPMVTYAAPVNAPNTFSADTIISSSEMNENFGALSAAINDNDGRITVLEAAPVAGSCTWTVQNEGPNLSVDVDCPVGTFALTGACRSTTLGDQVRTSEPVPVSDGGSATAMTGWRCGWNDNTSGTRATWALCCPL